MVVLINTNILGIVFYTFSVPSGGFGRSVIILSVDMSSSAYICNKEKDILILVKGLRQGSYDTPLTAQKKYSINFTEFEKKCLTLHYNGPNSYFFVNGVEIIKFKAKNSNNIATPLSLGSVSKDFSVDNIKKTGSYGYVYNFIVDYDVIAVNDILDIHKYLMKKHDIK